MSRKKSVKKIFIIFLNIGFLLLPLTTSYARCAINAVRSWTAPDYTRIVFDLDNPATIEDQSNKEGCAIIIMFKGCKGLVSENICKVESPLVNKMEIVESKPDSMIAKITLSKKTDYNIFQLKPYREKPDRVVIDIINPEYEKEEEKTTDNINKLKRFNWIIAIDPGHGGEDPGAMAKGKYKEKDIVLAVSKNLCDLLNKKDNIKAYLTRNGDYFLSLRERIEIAHKYHADLFISIHANACTKRQKRGASVYFLSRDGATDEATALLAERENASDKIGGISLGKDKVLDSILIDLAQTHTINESIDIGDKILEGLAAINGIKKEGLKCANFTVLKSPSIPSVLVELSYISNYNDLKLLLSKSYQSQMASMICNGVCKYFASRPPKELPAELYADSSPNDKNFKIHIVQKGETLWRISSLYGIPLDLLRKINGIDIVSTILVGQRLKIPE